MTWHSKSRNKRRTSQYPSDAASYDTKGSPLLENISSRGADYLKLKVEKELVGCRGLIEHLCNQFPISFPSFIASLDDYKGTHFEDIQKTSFEELKKSVREMLLPLIPNLKS